MRKTASMGLALALLDEHDDLDRELCGVQPGAAAAVRR